MRIKYFNDYGIDQYGQVKSYKFGREVIRKAIKIKNGYMTVILYNGEIKKLFYIHRLVAEYFIPNPENKKWVNHKDGNKQNNNISNLEWSTISENHLHAYRHLDRTRSNNHGSKNPNCKLTLDQVKEIIMRYNSGQSNAIELAKEFGINRNYIYELSKKKTWKAELENSLK